MRTQRMFPRLTVSVVGPDGHAPLHDYSDPYARVREIDIDGFPGWEYRAPGPCECALVVSAALVPGDQVLSWVWVPCDADGPFVGVNTVFDGFIASLATAGLVTGSWLSLEDFLADNSPVALAARAVWPERYLVEGVPTLPLVT